MARKPNRKPSRHKPASIGQRRRADARRAAAGQGPGDGTPPNNRLDHRVDKAQALWRENKFEEAIWYYERALARDPLNPVLLVDVARAYALRFRFTEAEKLIAQASDLYPNDALLQALLGESYAMVQQYDRAIACYYRSLELAPDSVKRPKILVELAQMHERLHDLGAAQQCAEQAVALEPENCAGRYALANIKRRRGDSAAAEVAWTELVGDERTPRKVAADSYYQLAALQDKSGRYDEAFASLATAKKILSSCSGRFADDAWEIGRASGKMVASLTADHCQRWASAATDLAPVGGRMALLTSHPRSGTTLLEEVLDCHQDAVGADEFQVMADLVHAAIGATARPEDSVVNVLDLTTPDRLNELRQVYWRGMEGAVRAPLNGRLLVDKNPELTMLLPLVARVFPDMKILFALRDPRDVVVSCFMQQLPLNSVSVHYLTLEGTVSKYVKMMHAWLKLREIIKNPWIEIRYEDMVTDLECQARRALEFLELPWDERVLDYHRRAQKKHVHSPTYEAVTKPVYSSSVGRWRNYEQYLAPYQEMLQPFVKVFGYE